MYIMFWSLFSNITDKEREEAIATIIKHASPRHEFFFMMMLSVSMAVFGVLLNSTVVIIGSMLIAPMLYPLLSLGLGIIMPDEQLMARSIITLGKATGLSLLVGFVIGLFFSGAVSGPSSVVDIIAGGQPSLLYAAVAVIAGFAGAFAMTRPHLNETLPGVAISVALVPPLAVAGVGLAHFDWAVASHALVLFLANVIGVTFAAVVVFSLFGFSRKRKVAEQEVKKDEKAVAAEVKEAHKPAASA